MSIYKYYPDTANPPELLWTLSSFNWDKWELGQIDLQSEEPYAVSAVDIDIAINVLIWILLPDKSECRKWSRSQWLGWI